MDGKLNKNSIRVIKISKQALFEFIYEKFIEGQEAFLDVDPLEVTNAFDIDFERGEFIFSAYKSENNKGEFIVFPENIDLQRLLAKLPDTSDTMFAANRYKDYTKDESKRISNA